MFSKFILQNLDQYWIIYLIIFSYFIHVDVNKCKYKFVLNSIIED